jgi:hypothetical protein
MEFVASRLVLQGKLSKKFFRKKENDKGQKLGIT